jgi:hypothetical protein
MDEHFCPVLAVALVCECANNSANINNLSLGLFNFNSNNCNLNSLHQNDCRKVVLDLNLGHIPQGFSKSHTNNRIPWLENQTITKPM